MTDYYDVGLKRDRLAVLKTFPGFEFTQARLETDGAIEEAAKGFRPDVIIHLAAQAGVRYSLDHPEEYVTSNIIGTFKVMEVARELSVEHLMMASSSSVYGANTHMPFAETDKTDTPMSIYAATKKANEAMGHSYAHLWNLPTTMFRFFTVYGPWGRPDLALFRFVEAMLDGKPIDIYNNGDMYRDFTYVDDLVRGIRLLMDAIPIRTEEGLIGSRDSLSPVAPYRVVNIGNSDKVRLLDFVEAIEESLGQKAIRNYLPIQKGDVPATWANADLLKLLTGYQPKTNIRDGVAAFVSWYRDYYGR